MARQSTQRNEGPEKVTLVSPDGEQQREVNVGSKEEVSLRFDGFLPREQQKLEAPEKPSAAPFTPTTTVPTTNA